MSDIVERLLRPTANGDVQRAEAAAEIARLQELLRGANRYWEGRWRDEKADNERLLADNEWLRAALREAARRLIANGDGYGASEAAAALEPKPRAALEPKP